MMRLRHKDKTAEAEATAPEVYPAESEAADDHSLHAEGETCARCGRAIGPDDECRRKANGDCVHLTC